jgi:hypothetical protein
MEGDMTFKQRLLLNAPWMAAAVIVNACANAQESSPTGQKPAGDQIAIQSFLNDPSLIRSAQVTPWTTVVALQGGWGIDRMLVFPAAPIVNANPPCSILTNGYIVNETHTGHNLFNTMLMSALLNRREVAFVISGCYQDRPQIVSVSIR